MDPKASAKAKRSFSKQGRRNHPTPAMIAQKKKAAQAGSEEKAQIAHSHVLPSNWDRYDDGEEEAESSSGTTLEGREIAPKSKGGNFTYLIGQARSQLQELRAPAMPETPSFFDQLTADFMRGVRSVHNVKRKNLLSRCEDDNFIVDDDHASNYEVPFLNLDLHAIDAQLSKFKLSERLFIEEDLFPENLRSDDSKGSISSVQSGQAIDLGQNMEAPDSFLHYPSSKTMLSHTEDHHITSLTDESPTNISKRTQYVAGEAEAKLDLLLESLKETTLQDDLCDEKISPGNNFVSSDLIDKTYLQSDGRIQASTSSIDDSIDDLLAETAPVLKLQEHTKGSMFSAPKDFSSRSTVGTEEFDSWMDSF